jgi:translation initiation factor 2 alpha subunit (eIF-2alpha)
MIRIEVAAAQLDKSTQYIRRKIQQGVLKHKLIKGVTHVDEDGVERLKEALQTLNPKKTLAK